jgi:ABC-type branched-subunit amino acid transport system substrate-binding protein
LDAQGVAFLSPLVGAADDQTVDCTHPWFRLAPSASTLGDNLAKLLAYPPAGSPAVSSVALLHSPDAYDEALASAVATRFASLGGTVAYEATLDANTQSYAGILSNALQASTGAIVLASSPLTGALIVDDATVGAAPQWFLSPLLKTDVLIQNTAPQTLESALGVTPAIFDTTQDFANAFSARWQGDTPLDGAYFYYDAMGLLGFALQATTLESGEFKATNLETALNTVAGPPGEPAGWNEIESGLGRLAQGKAIFYSGLTGPMLLGLCGDRRNGETSEWTIHSGKIVDLQGE